MCKNPRFCQLFHEANGIELLKWIIEDKDKRDEIHGSALCLLFKLASNSKPQDEVGSIEEIIEDNASTKPIF